VKASDVRCHGDPVTVVVGEPRPRTVVCLAWMEAELPGLALTAGDAFLVPSAPRGAPPTRRPGSWRSSEPTVADGI
jgi:hypothetical protein